MIRTFYKIILIVVLLNNISICFSQTTDLFDVLLKNSSIDHKALDRLDKSTVDGFLRAYFYVENVGTPENPNIGGISYGLKSTPDVRLTDEGREILIDLYKAAFYPSVNKNGGVGQGLEAYIRLMESELPLNVKAVLNKMIFNTIEKYIAYPSAKRKLGILAFDSIDGPEGLIKNEKVLNLMKDIKVQYMRTNKEMGEISIREYAKEVIKDQWIPHMKMTFNEEYLKSIYRGLGRHRKDLSKVFATKESGLNVQTYMNFWEELDSKNIDSSSSIRSGLSQIQAAVEPLTKCVNKAHSELVHKLVDP